MAPAGALFALALPLTASMSLNLRHRDGASGSPPFVYMLGVEGSNHHGVMAELLSPLVRERCNTGPCNEQSIKETPSSGDNLPPADPACPALQRDSAFRKELFGLNATGLTAAFAQHPSAWFVEDMSFPAGLTSREVPMPIDLGDMFRAVSPLTDFRFLVLQRSFGQLAASRAGFDASLEAHAEKMAEYLAYLSGELERVPSASWKVLPVGCLERGDEARVLAKERVAEFLGLSSQCCGCFQSWQSPTPHEQSDAVESIGESTIQDWPVFDPRDGGRFRGQYLLNPSTCKAQ